MSSSHCWFCYLPVWYVLLLVILKVSPSIGCMHVAVDVHRCRSHTNLLVRLHSLTLLLNHLPLSCRIFPMTCSSGTSRCNRHSNIQCARASLSQKTLRSVLLQSFIPFEKLKHLTSTASFKGY